MIINNLLLLILVVIAAIGAAAAWWATRTSRKMLGQIEALASDKRLQVLDWLRDPEANFRPQVDGDLVRDGVCGLLIAEKLGISQSTISRHMRQLVDAGLIRGKKIKQWTFYRRDEAAIRKMKQLIGRAM